MLVKTDFYSDFIAYYNKAKVLQNKNKGINPEASVDDPLMDNISIYDTIQRRYAGFSKVLQDIHGMREIGTPRLKSYNLTLEQFHYLYLFHRFTGSGASFQPRYINGQLNPKEHGYCNSIVGDLANILSQTNSFKAAASYICSYNNPMVTSIGNQPPSIKNKEPEKYRLAIQYYFDTHAHLFITDYCNFICKKQRTITEAVDFCLDWHSNKGFKRWKFVITAFVMDTADYFPELVDINSDCYHGANCIKTFNRIFASLKSSQHHEAMATIVNDTNGFPMDLEDVCCDYVRYLDEYHPKGYTTVYKNNSTLKVNGEYPLEILKIIRESL